MVLTTIEYNTLNRIARLTKMDCWFYLKEDKRGNDYIYDLEEHKRIGWKRGLSYLAEGIVDLNEFGLTDEERIAFVRLLEKLKITY